MSSPSRASPPESFVDENGVIWFSRLARAIHVFVQARAKLVNFEDTDDPTLVADFTAAFTRAANAVIQTAESAGDDEVNRVEDELSRMQTEDRIALNTATSEGRQRRLRARLDEINSVLSHLQQRHELSRSIWSISTTSPLASRRGSRAQPDHHPVRPIFPCPHCRAGTDRHLQHAERNLGLSATAHRRVFSPFLPEPRRAL